MRLALVIVATLVPVLAQGAACELPLDVIARQLDKTESSLAAGHVGIGMADDG
jgi:hypothetical protein